MKDDWVKYLESIGIKGPFRERVKEIFDFFEQASPDELTDIFVTDYFDEDGNRQYENLWLFSDTAVMEAKRFLKEDNFDFIHLKNQIGYWVIEKSEYDFKEATMKSRMKLYFSFVSNNLCEIKASRENCEHLKALFFKYVIPNTVQSPFVVRQMDADES